MDIKKFSPVFILVCMFFANCAGKKHLTSVSSDETNQQIESNKPFVFKHPGILNSEAQLSFIKQKLKAGEEPWKSAFEKLKNTPYASADYKPKPYEVVNCGFYNKPNIGCDQQAEDGMAVYCNALMYCFTSDEKYAK